MICTDAWESALWLRCRHGCPWGAHSFLIGHFGTELLLSSASPWGRHAALIRSRLCLYRCVSEQTSRSAWAVGPGYGLPMLPAVARGCLLAWMHGDPCLRGHLLRPLAVCITGDLCRSHGAVLWPSLSQQTAYLNSRKLRLAQLSVAVPCPRRMSCLVLYLRSCP